MEGDKVDYNREPVFYCRHCLSLKVKLMDEEHDTEFLDYCDDCGSTDIGQANIHDWEDMYRKKYGKDFLTEEEV